MTNKTQPSFPRLIELPRLEFPLGWGEDGAAFVRLRLYQDGTMSILCTKAEDAKKTNVTHAVARIFEAVMRKLDELGHLKIDPAIDGSGSQTSREALAKLAKSVHWVEYTAPEDAAYSPDGSYAGVAFDVALNPSWNYMSMKDLCKLPGFDEAFLKLKSQTDKAPGAQGSAEAILHEQLDQLFMTLNGIEPLLRQGRSVGIQVALSQGAKDLIHAKHGDAAQGVLANCQTLEDSGQCA